MSKQHINPIGLFKCLDHGFSQVVVSQPGRIVHISGQVAWDENKQIVGKGDFETQTRKSLENLKLAIESAGGNLEDITMLRIYIASEESDSWDIVEQFLLESFPKHPPASSILHVQRLANPDFMIEIEAEGVIEA